MHVDAVDLQYLANKPIDSAERAGKLWLPMGKLPPRKRPPEELANSRANAAMGRVREKERNERRRSELLDYYATTSLSADTVAGHIGETDVIAVTKELAKRRK